jgi:hypothetical protein
VIDIRYFKDLYVDEDCKPVENEMFSCIASGNAVFNVYAVCVSDMGNTLFEILDIKNLVKPVNAPKNYGIIALVRGKKNAVHYIEHLITDWIEKNKTTDGIKEYYNNGCD